FDNSKDKSTTSTLPSLFMSPTRPFPVLPQLASSLLKSTIPTVQSWFRSAGWYTSSWTGVDEPVLPDLSMAVAMATWIPHLALLLSHLRLYGDVVSVPTSAPSTLKLTFAIPALSLAVALIVTSPWTIALFAGEVIDTFGCDWSSDFKVILVDALLPAAS